MTEDLNPGLIVNPEVAMLADEVKQYEWHGGQTSQERLVGLMRMEMDVERLRAWLHTYTKVAQDGNPVDQAMLLLDTARTMVEHLTPAVVQILTSAISALQSAGVAMPEWPSPPTEPSLGLASTEQMLRELKARGEIAFPKSGGQGMARKMSYLLANLPEETLEYRTVDE